jgi:outer membrane receptor protein involved in Fe transport
MIANLGIRFDFWIPGRYLERAVEEALAREDLHNVVRREYERYIESSYKVPLLDGYRMKAQLSPRIGVAYPISESDKFFLSFGHFSQMPDFKYVFSKLGVRASSTYELEGNPNLKPITTVMYELGVEHLFGPAFKLSVTAYYKDVFNYPTASSVPAESPNEPDFWMYFNSDYSRSFGIEFLLKKRLTGHIYGDLELTLAQAMGKASTEEDQYWRGEAETLKEWHLRWDRPWKIYARLGMRYRRGDHPVLFGFTLPDNWRLNLTASIQAGRRYTPEDSLGIQGELYSALGPIWHTVEFTFKKGFGVGPLDVWLTLEGRNIFNHRNVYYVNELTGRAYEPGDPYVGMPDTILEFNLLNPARYREPRSFLLGLEVSW